MKRPRALDGLLPSRHDRAASVYFGVFSLASLAVVGFAVLSSRNLGYFDEQQYLDIARSVAGGDGFEYDGSPTAFRPPTWPLALALPLIVHVPAAWLGLVPALFLIAAAAVVYALANRLAGRPAAMIAGLAMLLYPLNVYTAGTLYPQAFATTAVVVMWWIVSLAGDEGRRPLGTTAAAVLGLTGALLMLAVPTMAFTVVAVLGWVWWQQRGNRLRFTIVAGLLLTLPIAGWAARNELQTGSATVLSTSSGVNLLLGNSEHATPDSGVNVDIDKYVAVAEKLDSEAEVDGYYRNAAIDWIVAHPRSAATLYLGKVANYFSAYNEPATTGQSSALQRLVAWMSFGALVALTVVRVALRRIVALRQSEKLFLAIFLANAMFMAVFFTRTRFRQPLDSVLIVEAAVALAAVGGVLIAHFARRRDDREPESEPGAMTRSGG